MANTESCPPHLLALEDLAGVLECGLKKNYAEVHVKVMECPGLTLESFGFPVKGLCGKSRIADVRGVPYLVPTARLDKICNMNTVAKKIDLPGAYLLGARATSQKVFSIKAESATSPAVNGNYMANINPTDNSCLLEKYRQKYSDHPFGLLSNLYACEGNSGKVLKVKVWLARGTGKDNFVNCIRKSLKVQYENKSVGLGASFIIQESSLQGPNPEHGSTRRIHEGQKTENHHVYKKNEDDGNKKL
ncbi:LOW QUALITY PROTEIN: ester hydrolase C11orf54 homolog [Anomaloglossus baeobatrachus]